MQPARIGGQRGPAALLGDVHNVSGAPIEDIGVEKYLVDLACCGGVEDFAADHSVVSGATRWRRRISSSPGHGAPKLA